METPLPWDLLVLRKRLELSSAPLQYFRCKQGAVLPVKLSEKVGVWTATPYVIYNQNQ